MARNHLKPTTIDLFAGVGGMSLGATRAGFDLKAAVEWDSIALATHSINFPQSVHLANDIGALSGKELLSKAGLSTRLDGLIGGPPCQGFSNIGKRVVDDPRNSLFGHFFRLVREIKPKFFIAENVPGVLAERNHETVSAALESLPKTYVLIKPQEVQAHQMGAATYRSRVFFIGYDPEAINALDAESLFAAIGDSQVNVGEALKGLPLVRDDWQTEEQGWRKVKFSGRSTYFHDRLKAAVPDGVGCQSSLKNLNEHGLVSGNLGTKHTEDVMRRFNEVVPGTTDPISRAPRLRADGLCPTLRAGTASDRGSFQAVRPIHFKYPRVITPREAARLQGFPDWFQFHETKWHSFRQIGNSVSPMVAEAILRRIGQRLV